MHRDNQILRFAGNSAIRAIWLLDKLQMAQPDSRKLVFPQMMNIRTMAHRRKRMGGNGQPSSDTQGGDDRIPNGREGESPETAESANPQYTPVARGDRTFKLKAGKVARVSAKRRKKDEAVEIKKERRGEGNKCRIKVMVKDDPSSASAEIQHGWRLGSLLSVGLASISHSRSSPDGNRVVGNLLPHRSPSGAGGYR